ncbi:MAG TPA: hypothetical protein VGS16_06665 [Candidatus Dormibacteraeota bacterium]|nr:hypothetical protein [Candidatus Dormibacteraeota bacterium]
MLPAVLIATELAFVILAAVLTVRVWRQFKRNRAEVGDSWTALEEAVGQQLGPIAARLIVGEPKLWAAIFLWTSGRSPRDARSFHYSASSSLGLVSVVVLGLILLEGVGGGLLARLAPWPWLSPVLIIISAYAAIWIIGIYASLRAFPHLVTERGLLLRYGVLGEAWIPWREVDEVVKETLASPGGQDGLLTRGGIATLAVGGKTAVTIRRQSPGLVKGFLRQTAGIGQIRVAADDPDALLAAITAAIPRGAG